MIKLTKLAQPDILRDNEETWIREYKEAKVSGEPDAKIEKLKTRYRHPDIKEIIVRETRKKCAYCESQIRHSYPGDVEHIKPTSLSDDNLFDWRNLTLSCGECNRRKSNHVDDEVGILNPYEDEPENHLLAFGPMILPKAGDLKGILAELLFEFNRPELLERRVDRIKSVQRLIESYARETNPLIKALYKRRLDDETNEDLEYLMVTKAFIKQAVAPRKRKRVSQNSS